MNREAVGERKDEFEHFITQGEVVVAFQNEEKMDVAGFDGKVPARQRLSIKDVVWDPPESRLRKVIRSG